MFRIVWHDGTEKSKTIANNVMGQKQNYSESDATVPISGDGVDEERLPLTDALEYRIHDRSLLEPTLQNSETSESEESPVMTPSVLVTNDGDDDGSAKKIVLILVIFGLCKVINNYRNFNLVIKSHLSHPVCLTWFAGQFLRCLFFGP